MYTIQYVKNQRVVDVFMKKCSNGMWTVCYLDINKEHCYIPNRLVYMGHKMATTIVRGDLKYIQRNQGVIT